MNLQDFPARFREKVELGDDGCWLWTAATSSEGELSSWKGGYPYYWLNGRTVGAHRYAFQRAMGVSVAGLDLHHVCETRRCVNPEHLDPVTRQEHMERTGGLNGW